ncbi:hypothetical protein F0L68_29290 [Solihabitans fulvus]|uniref:Uncharacterized protein n=1 Tax=Solihabitans fulvus TaxID=1892852 RepID=A0A5B2WV19_9PSEU|nr:hypothetical protein [Solihabitans fulvus]KAA2254878.1 hypothetical protein F0L68_29290 [Solihabitans fulvus]
MPDQVQPNDESETTPENTEEVVLNRRERRAGGKSIPVANKVPIGKPRGVVVHNRSYSNRRSG